MASVTWQYSLVALIIHTRVLGLDHFRAEAEACLRCKQLGTVVTFLKGFIHCRDVEKPR